MEMTVIDAKNVVSRRRFRRSLLVFNHDCPRSNVADGAEATDSTL